MGRTSQHDTTREAHMQLSPGYKSSSPSIAICLLFSAFALVVLLFRPFLRRNKRSFAAATLPSWSTRTMSDSKKDELPPPTPEAQLIEPEFPNPLAGVYFPITSGQLARLADAQAAQSQPEQRQGDESEQTESTTTAAHQEAEADATEAQLTAAIRYFEDTENRELWQRRAVFFKTRGPDGRNTT